MPRQKKPMSEPLEPPLPQDAKDSVEILETQVETNSKDGETVEQPLENSHLETERKIDHIFSIVKTLERPPSQWRKKKKAEAKPEPKTATDFLQRQNQIIEKLQQFDSLHKAFLDEIEKNLAKMRVLEPNDEKGLQIIEECSSNISKILFEAAELESDARVLPDLAQEANEEYERLFLHENKFFSYEELLQAANTCSNNLFQLERKNFISKWLSKEKILELKQEKLRLEKLRRDFRQDTFFPSIDKWDAKRKRENLLQETKTVITRLIIERYQHEIFDAREREALDSKIIQDIHEDLVQSKLVLKLNELREVRIGHSHADPDDPEFELSKEHIAKAVALARQAVDNEYVQIYQEQNEFTSQIQSLPHGVKAPTSEFIRKYSGKENTERLQNFFSVCSHIEALITEENQRHIFRERLYQLDNINGSSDYRTHQIISKAQETFHQSPHQIETLINTFDKDQWEAFIQNPDIRAHFGEEKIQKIESYLAHTFAKRIIMAEDNRDIRVQLGQNLFSLKNASSVPLVILNSYRETGHSGENPFLPRYSGQTDSHLNNYIFDLTNENTEKIKEMNIPGLEEFIDLVKKHPGNYNVEILYQKNSETSLENPIYKKIHDALAKIIAHLLEKGDRVSQYFAAETFATCRNDSDSGYDVVEKILTTTKDEALQKKLLQSLLKRNRNYGDKKALIFLFQKLDALDETSTEYLRSQFHTILEQFVDNEWETKTPSEDEIKGLSRVSGYSESQITSLIHFLSYLAKNDQPYRSNDRINIEQYVSLTSDEQAVDLVKRLKNFSYQFDDSDAPKILGLAHDTTSLQNLDRIGECLTKKFLKRYNRGVWKNAFEQPEMMAQILEEIPTEIFNELDTFIRFAKIFQNSEPEQRQECYVLLQKILKSPSQKIQYLKHSLLPNTYEENLSPNDILVKLKNVTDILEELPEAILIDEDFFTVFFKNSEKFFSFPLEKRQSAYRVIEKVYHSPSQEIQRLREQIFFELLETENPEKAFAEIENIFVKNNLPLVGKIYKVFEILHPAKVLDEKLKKDLSSPVLVHATEKRRRLTIYHDLLRIHLESGNRNLKHYLEFLESGEKIFTKIDEVGEDNLSAREKKIALSLIKKLQTLSETIDLPATDFSDDETSLHDEIQKLKSGLGAKKGQTLNSRILEIFAKPLGFESISEALNYIQSKKQTAHERNIRSVQENTTETEHGTKCYFQLQENDQLKGVDVQFISQILQNGSVAKEFLGASSGSDMTPLDTDTSRVLQSDLEGGFTKTYEHSIAKSYGGLCFVIRDRGQFELTSPETKRQKDKTKLELFATSAVDKKRHFGIRTGFPSTEIDFMIAKDEFIKEPKRLQSLYCELAKNGYYIPVVDTTGRLLFTPEMFETHRKAYEGLEVFDGGDISVIRTTESNSHYEQVAVLQSQMEKDHKHLERLLENIRLIVQETLSEFGVTLKEEFDSNITDAEFYDTGSTGRGTYTPGSYDFDYTLKLSEPDIAKIPAIVKAIQAKLNPDADYSKSHSEANGYYQFRADKVRLGKDTDLAIDIGFGRKNELSEFSSHDAINSKLSNIEKTSGKEVRKEVVANIVLTKQVLKEAGIYKKLDKGLGGIGVETWLLQHGGNMIEAFKAFHDAAHYEDVPLPFDEFKKRYSILDAGINIKHLTYDNFVYNLSDETYQKMLIVIEKYISSEV